jgi:hypothetical protein
VETISAVQTSSGSSTDHVTGSFTGTGCVIPSSTGTASCG